MWTHKIAILTILAAFVLFLATPGLARADEGNGGMEMVVNGYHVRLIFPNPAKTGENQFHVQLVGADGSPVTSAAVQVAAQPVAETVPSATPDDGMAGMAGMSGMSAATPTAEAMAGVNVNEPAAQPVSVALQAGSDAGDYDGTISFPQAGHWALHMHVMLTNGEMFSTEFPLDVAPGAPASYGILAGFFGLNVLIIVAAVVTKRKTVRA
ncbi:MAG: hypothetical protein WA821_07535 [Anaerolineales bacterium]